MSPTCCVMPEQVWVGSAEADEDHLLWQQLLSASDLHEPEQAGQVVWAVPGVDLPRQPVRDLLAPLRTVLGDLVLPQGLSGRELLEHTRGLLQLSQQLRVLTADALAQVHARGVQELDGAQSVKAWARRVTPDLAPGDVTVGRELARWQALSDAVHDGAVSLAAAAQVARALGQARPHVDQADGLIDGQPAGPVLDAIGDNTVQLIASATLGLTEQQLADLDREVARVRLLPTEIARVEGCLVLLARQVSAVVLPGCLQQQLDALVPSVLEDDAEQARDDRYLTLSKKLHGRGMRTVIDSDLETGELFHACLAAAARRDPQNPSDTARSTHPDPDLPWDLQLDQAGGLGATDSPRTRGQRRHDAFVRILEHYRDSGAVGTHDKQPVRITVTVPAGQLDGQPGALPAVGATRQTLPRSLVQTWWCNAEVTALLVSRAWRALGDTHSQRTATARERRALLVENAGRCARDGCCHPDDPLTDLVPHHVTRWSSTGTTTTTDTVLVCPSLHHDLHHGRTVRLRDGRLLSEQGWVGESGQPS